MPNISKRDHSILLNILDSVNKILEFTSGCTDEKDFQKDYLRFDASLMNFIVIGEMVGKLSNDLKENYKHIDWEKIYAFRNVIAHDYFGLLEKEVFEIIKKDLPIFKKALEKLV
jgi:uncharacterized protein with HEPN domain